MEVPARIFPAKLAVVSSVAALPTCQKILHGLTLMSVTREPGVASRAVPILKTKIPAPPRREPLSVSCPVNVAVVAKQYTAGVRVGRLPRSWPVNVTSHGCWPAFVEAAVASPRAVAAGPSVMCIVPSVTVPGGNPVTDDPGLTPRLPCTMLDPVFVTALAPSTANVLAVAPSDGGGFVKARVVAGNHRRASKGTTKVDSTYLCRFMVAAPFGDSRRREAIHKQLSAMQIVTHKYLVSAHFDDRHWGSTATASANHRGYFSKEPGV